MLKKANPLSKDKEDFLEIFCPPRMVPIAKSKGLTATLSMDLLTGWNFLDPRVRAYVRSLVRARKPTLIHVSPPCTMYSKVLHSNKNRMDPTKLAVRRAEGQALLEFAMEMCTLQAKSKRFFSFEHPDGASSWAEAKVRDVEALRGVMKARFDQCTFGLVSKEEKLPIQKRTVIMTNLKPLHDQFSGKFCTCTVPHQVCQGSEGGVRRCAWAAKYPVPMATAIVKSMRVDHVVDAPHRSS